MTTLLVALIVFVLGYATGMWHARRTPPVISGDGVRYRVAVHEAAHAVLAWHNPYLAEILGVTVGSGVKDGSGLTTYSIEVGPCRAMADWHDTATCAAGIAGELLFLKTTRSGDSQSDLHRTLAKVRALAKTHSSPPWETTTQESFDPVVFYRVGALTPEEVHVLRTCFARAREVLRQCETKHGELTALLVERGQAKHEDLRRILGPRSFR